MKKCLLILLVFISISFIAESQNVLFSDLADLPSARSAVSSANDSENIYVVNGFGVDSALHSEVFKYNIAMDLWSILTNSTLAKWYASAAIVGNYLYIFNGYSNPGGFNEIVEVVDLETGSITFASNNPQPVRNGGVSVWNDKIYSFGGATGGGNYSNKLFEFDPLSNIWTELAMMPISLETKGEIIDGKLYVFGGYNGTASNRIDIYNISTNLWETELTMPLGVSAHSTAIIGSRIYLIGDYSDLTFLAYFETIDYSFHIIQSNLNPRRHCSAEGANGNLYAIGGNTTTSLGSAIKSVQVSDNLITDIKNNKNHNLSIYPNPTNDILSWNFELNSVMLIDIIGKILIEYDGNNKEIDVSNFEDGIYIFVGHNKDKKYVLKWLKK